MHAGRQVSTSSHISATPSTVLHDEFGSYPEWECSEVQALQGMGSWLQEAF